MSLSPVELAKKQLDAYNRQDIDAFLSAYSSNVEVREFPSNNLIYSGNDKMREVYTNLFKANPKQHAELKARTAHLNVVIDHELVTGRTNRIDAEAVAMYEIKDGSISKVWFIK
ncbi:nuclear transport factor 2 family protein [Peribacillus deserti]|uniref:Steroid delta-isomerase n=1 Tax=Peribacillus deserti TaxID=673318 RepID=A0A2N5M6J3_9BACI|nr:nuclear transport factor 2 family protein [Peribacillus deserti]PLT29979.1 steroid delta-isomerase [Peribacillus deserti]